MRMMQLSDDSGAEIKDICVSSSHRVLRQESLIHGDLDSEIPMGFAIF